MRAYPPIAMLLVAMLLGAPALGDSGFDELSMYTVPLAGFSRAIYAERSSTFVIYSSSGEFRLPATPFQRVAASRALEGGREYTLNTGRAAPGAREDLSRFTADTRLLGIRSPEIRAAGAGFENHRDPVAGVMGFVYGHITRKTEGIPIISAREVLRNRTGDCTEHAVLTVALLRSLGVPCRAVVGMILCERFYHIENSFVFHMWVEAYAGGGWRLVDSTRPRDIHPNRYVALSYHDLRSEMPLSYLGAVSSIRDLRVRYLPVR